LNQSVFSDDKAKQKEQENIVNWAQAPHARFAHPREEHLLPLLVCLGPAQGANYQVQNFSMKHL